MKYVFVYNMPDGKVYKTEPAPGINLVRAKEDIPFGYINLRLIDIAKLPDRVWREAWVLDSDNRLVVDYSVVRGIIRRERNKALSLLDMKVLSAQRGKNLELEKKLETEAQRLRDIPQHQDFENTDLQALKQLLMACRIREGL